MDGQTKQQGGQVSPCLGKRAFSAAMATYLTIVDGSLCFRKAHFSFCASLVLLNELRGAFQWAL
ncbi:hypothetical protein [Phaeobacter sp. 11ANDIMAR09]|uniref:hypothetical protein n=1 Tax=Phaeobacter sp. 11ANDIMAR09 TaxID=1225647 RepID=UPI0006D6D814|nr:hypothetical protein [Phaeobacter sp. 11ANDIMAR09]KPD13900.1 hypothetical protein AN476_01550 [Phaeobacter sp. 11ANDIMAR09]